MSRILACIAQDHDIRLVFLAAIICLFGSLTAVALVGRARQAGRWQLAWITSAAVATGGSIWATHFVAMLAFRTGLPFDYDVERTALSVLAAILLTWIGVAIGLPRPNPARLGRAWFGGAIVGLATAAMHFIGMSALMLPGEVRYEIGYVLAALAAGGGLIALAVAVALRRGGLLRGIASAASLALGICVLHFTAMAAVRIEPLLIDMPLDRIEAPAWVALAVAGATGVVLAFGMVAIAVDQHLGRRAIREAERLREHIVELEATKRQLEDTAASLSRALDAAAAASQAKSQFLATMSHELRTPLNAIIGFSETMAGEAFGPIENPRYREYVADIRDSGVHLLAVINDILDLAKLDAGHMDFHREPLDPRQVIDDAIRYVRPQAAKAGLVLEQRAATADAYLLGDPRRIRQILLNLLSNAIKFTPAGGTVRVLAEAGPDHIRLIVSDTGIGMSAEQIPIALERFGQIDSSLARRYEGSGLGLPLAKRLTEQQSGRLSIDSALGQGTTVTVELPLAAREIASAAA